MVAISIKNLNKRFGDYQALREVNLTIAAGELFFLLGPSGCGKTTLLRHIAGFYQPDSGSIWFDAEEVTRTPAHRRGTGMMFQSYALWPHMSVAENIAFGLEEQRVSKPEIAQRVAQSLAAVKLEGLGERRIPQLSGGQQQRVALARALVIRPKCLLLDEPLSNLDAKLRLEMRLEIRRICKEFGLTGIYVTHDQEEALSMADRIAIMDKGQLIQLGTPSDIYHKPANAMVAEFIGETNFIDGKVQGVDAQGIYSVQCGFGAVRGKVMGPAWQPHPGDAVTVSIRPEVLRFGSASSDSNVFPTRVAQTVYLGATVQYLIEIKGDILLKLCEMNPAEIRAPSAESLNAYADLDDCVVLPARARTA
jgi:ABC-type Fe3+/spermidine/putrescine transport system ATPase subunit